MNHADFRIILREAFRQAFSREATTSEAQHAQAIADLESNLGMGWKPPGDGSNNFGAQQAGSGWTGDTFQYTDTRPNADGTSTPYVTKFRKYPTPIAGAVDLIKTVYVSAGRAAVLKAAGEGNSLRFSAGLYCPSSPKPDVVARENAEVLAQFGIKPTGYYQGFGKDPAERIGHHHDRVVRSIRKQAELLHESLPADIAVLPRVRETVRMGSAGLDVQALQVALNAAGATPQLTADGSFGAKTLAALKSFQGAHHLIADGVCGPATWAALGAA